MKYHLTGFGISALLHISVLLASMPLLLWQDRLGQVEEPQPVTLSLAQFVPAPPPEPVAAPPPVAEPVPEPEPKPVEKPESKPKAEKKPVEKTKLKPKKQPSQSKPQHEPEPKSQSQAQAVATAPAASRPATPNAQAAPPTPPAGNQAAEAAYKARLEKLIAARKQYPHKAEESGVEGSVAVSFTVIPNGAISGVRISKSSGNTWLDKAALQAVKSTSGALPFPPEIRKPQWTFSLTVNFRLDW